MDVSGRHTPAQARSAQWRCLHDSWRGQQHHRTLYQTVAIPAAALIYNFLAEYHYQRGGGAAVYDRLFIEVRNTSGTLLATLATFSNQNSGTAGVYVLRELQPQRFTPVRRCGFSSVPLRICRLPTSFRVDDAR